MTKVSYEDFLRADSDYIGWCTTCKDFTREETEPDAECYDCPECGEDTVMGTENALMTGEVDPE
jgi:predicted RNA-binding Zn-ribbon protein involved in translation (DUF1610 family)